MKNILLSMVFIAILIYAVYYLSTVKMSMAILIQTIIISIVFGSFLETIIKKK